MNGAERLRTKIWGNRPREVISRGNLRRSPYLSLLRSLLTDFHDTVSTVGQEVTLNVEDLGGIDERGDSW